MKMSALRIAVYCMFLFLAQTAITAGAGTWRTEAGYRFLNNVDELKDTCERISENEGKGGDVHKVSINVQVQPYHQFDNGFQIGAGFGPFVIVADDTWHLLIPANATLGWSFLRRAMVSPYVKTGISYHYSEGDYQERSIPGAYAGIGIRFFNRNALKLGLEIAHDGARTELYDPTEQKKHTLRVGKLTLGIFGDF